MTKASRRRAQGAEPEKPVIAGTFHIAEMGLWDEDFLNLVVQAFIRFQPDGRGEFRFGAVQASLDYRNTTREGKPAVDFSFEGFDECDEVSGRGWAVLEAKEVLNGMIFFHLGDESGFAAERKT